MYDRYGTPDVLRVGEVPRPTPGTGEVLVQVHASSVNDWDYHRLTGRPLLNRAAALRRPGNPAIPGADVAGVVAGLGPGVARLADGDRVYGDVSSAGFGAFADYVAAPESCFTPVPAGVPLLDAAATPQAAGLASTALRSRPVRPGDRVLVNGAGGGVGTFAIQMATAAGAEVTAVDRASKLAALAPLGAAVLVDYQTEDVPHRGETYDLILDVAAQWPIRTYRRLLRLHGAAAVMGGALPTVFWVMAAGPVSSLASSRLVRVPFWRPNDPVDVALVSRLLESGTVRPVVDSVVPLEGVADAFRRFEAQQHVGKIVVQVQPTG